MLRHKWLGVCGGFSVLLVAPALAAVGVGLPSNGFDPNAVYAVGGNYAVSAQGSATGGVGGIWKYNQTTGALIGSLTTDNLAKEPSLTFSYSSSAGVNSPAGARLFTANGVDSFNAAGTAGTDGVIDDIRIQEWNASGTLIRTTKVSSAFGGTRLTAASGDSLNFGCVRYNPVNNTLMVSANPKQNGNPNVASKVWEISLPDWASGSGTATAAHAAWVLPTNRTNNTWIDVAPNGDIYSLGYMLGTPQTTATPRNGNLYRTPTSGGSAGTNFLMINGALAEASTPVFSNGTGGVGGNWHDPKCPIYRESNNGPRILTTHDFGGNIRYVNEFADTGTPSAYGVLTWQDAALYAAALDGVPDNAEWDRTNLGQRDPLNGDVFITGQDVDLADPWWGLDFYRPDDSGLNTGLGVSFNDAASPVPEPASLLLLGVATFPLLRRRRAK